MATTSVLCEHAEKIVAAISLKNLHGRYVLLNSIKALNLAPLNFFLNFFSFGTLIEQCIKYVVGDEKPQHGLTLQDLFYREVSKITEGLQALTQWSENVCHSDRRPQEIALALRDANSVIVVSTQSINFLNHQKNSFLIFYF